jgi:hypothetical protein
MLEKVLPADAQRQEEEHAEGKVGDGGSSPSSGPDPGYSRVESMAETTERACVVQAVGPYKGSVPRPSDGR